MCPTPVWETKTTGMQAATSSSTTHVLPTEACLFRVLIVMHSIALCRARESTTNQPPSTRGMRCQRGGDARRAGSAGDRDARWLRRLGYHSGSLSACLQLFVFSLGGPHRLLSGAVAAPSSRSSVCRVAGGSCWRLRL